MSDFAGKGPRRVGAGTKLRRDPLAFFGGYMLENAVALIAPPVAAMFLAAPDRGIQAFGWTVLVVSLPILFLSWSTTVLDKSELRSGLRYRPLRIPRAAIVRATVGKVGWGQGFVKGIELDLVSGRKQRLSLSANLLSERREKWIESINQWSEDDEPAVDIFGTTHTLVLSPKRQTEVLAYLAKQPDGGNVVLVAEFDKGTPRLDHGWTTRTAAGGNESVKLTYPRTTIGSLSLEPDRPTTITITGARQKGSPRSSSLLKPTIVFSWFCRATVSK